MKKLLCAVVLCPIFAFCSHDKPVSPDDISRVAYKSYGDQFMDTEPFWCDIIEDDYKLADFHLNKMRPHNFNERVYVRLCKLYMAYREGNSTEMAIADMDLQEELENYLYD